MAAPYSVDLRQKIVLALEDGGKSQREIAALFHVSQIFVETLLRQVRATGRIEPKPARGGLPPRIDEQARQRLREWLAEQPDLTLAEPFLDVTRLLVQRCLNQLENIGRC